MIDLWSIAWRSKWLLIGVAAFFSGASVLYALLAPEWYRSEVLLSPADKTYSQSLGGSLGGLGGLAGLTGIDLSNQNSAEAIAILRSRDFIRSFIEDNELLPILLHSEWDEAAEQWKEQDVSLQPDVRDAIKVFQNEVQRVSEDPATGLVTLTIDWTDPATSAAWAMQLVGRLNEHMRRRALLESEENIAYLQEQLAATSVATLRESIGNVLEGELQKLMLARGNEQYAFRIVDSAQVPKERVRPRRTLIVIFATMLGLAIAMVVVSVRWVFSHGVRRRE